VLKNHKWAKCQLLNYHRYSNSTLSRDYYLLLKRVNFCSETIEKKCLMLSLIKEAELERFQWKKLRAFCHLRTFWGFDCLAVRGNNLETRAEKAAPSWGSYNFTNSILAVWEWLNQLWKRLIQNGLQWTPRRPRGRLSDGFFNSQVPQCWPNNRA